MRAFFEVKVVFCVQGWIDGHVRRDFVSVGWRVVMAHVC